jgi:hypothetical protein
MKDEPYTVKYVVRQCREMPNQSVLLIGFLFFLLFTTSKLVASIILNMAVLVFEGYFSGFDVFEPGLHRKISLVIFDRVFLLTLMALVWPFLE